MGRHGHSDIARCWAQWHLAPRSHRPGRRYSHKHGSIDIPTSMVPLSDTTFAASGTIKSRLNVGLLLHGNILSFAYSAVPSRRPLPPHAASIACTALAT
jgi:hypothetical protein